MSNLFKSKFVLGLMLVAAFTFVTSTASAAITSTLKLGSNNSQVKELQQGLNSQGFVVSTSGAGSVGSETNYFGSKTKTAVQAWQASKGVPATGTFGPLSRAAWTGTTGGTYPAGCSSSTGFSTTTGLPCSGGSTTYPAGCSSSTGFSSTTGLPCTGTTSQTGPVTASLAANNPASGTLVAGQATADLAHFTFSGSGTVTAVTLQRIGVSADTTPSNVYLFDGATRLTDAASVSNNGSVTFNVPAGIFTVNGTKTISVRSDIASGTSGQTVGMMLATFTTSAGSTTANLSGNIHSIAQATLATVTVTPGTTTPSGATLNPGAAVTVWQSNLNISQRDVWMKRIAFRNVGSAPANAFANFKLFVNGVQVATATGLDINGYVTFDMSATPVMLVSGSRVVRVDADIVSGASRTVHFSMRNAADVDFVDSSFGVNIVPTSSPWSPTTASTISGVGGGSLTIEKDVTSPSSNLTLGGNNVKIATYKVTAYGEPIKIETIRAAYTGSANINADDDSLRNAKILIGGVQYGSTASLNETTDTVLAYTSFTTNYTVNPGTPVLMDLYADMYDDSGTNDLVAADTIIGVIAVGSSNAQKVDSLGSFNAPAVAVNGNTLTVASATVTLTKNATYANQSASLPATAFKIGAWNVVGSSVEDVLLTTMSFDINEVTGATLNESDLTNLYAVVKNGSTIVAQPTPLATVAATGNAFSINYTLPKNASVSIELYANIGSTATVTHSFAPDLTLTGTASVSGTAVTPALVTGQTIISGTASVTVSKDASSVVSGIVYDNQTVSALAAKFAAVTAGYNVTDITVTLGDATNVQSVQLWDGATQVGSSQQGAATVTFNGLNWNVPANTNKVLTVKLVLGSVGVGAGTSGASIVTTMTAFTATNTSTGVSAVGTGTATSSNLNVFAAIPTITEVALSNTTLLNTPARPLVKFTMAGNGGDIAWAQLTFKVTKDAATTVGTNATTGISLWDVTNGGNTEVVGVFTNAATVYGAGAGPSDIGFVPTSEQVVSGSKTYELRGNIAAADASGDFVTVTLDNDSSSIVASGTLAAKLAADTDAPIIWSDMSASSHATTTADWTTDFGIKNLPVSGSLNWAN